MKWFKHRSGSLNDNLVFEAIEKFGSDAYLVFFGTLEHLADEFDYQSPGIQTFSLKKLTKNFQLSRQKVVKILQHFDQKAKENSHKNISFFATIEGDRVTINCKKFVKLLDEYTSKKTGKVSGQTLEGVGTNSHTEARSKNKDIKNKEKEEMHKEEKESPFELPSKEDIVESSPSWIRDKIDEVCKRLVQENIYPEAVNYVLAKRNMRVSERALLHALCRVHISKPKHPKAFMDKIIAIENGNYNEYEHCQSS